jgi:hypothetical protein
MTGKLYATATLIAGKKSTITKGQKADWDTELVGGDGEAKNRCPCRRIEPRSRFSHPGALLTEPKLIMLECI